MAVKARAEITLSSIRDVQSVTRYYLLQSSTSAVPSKPTTNPPGGNWVTAEPTYTSGSTNSLYFVDLTVFSDGTFAYSDVSLSSSYEAAKVAYNKAASAEDVANSASDKVDNLEVGGRNLVRRTDYSIYGNSNNYTNANQAIFSSDRITIPFGKEVWQNQFTRNKLKTPIPKGTKIIMSVYVYEQTVPDGNHRLYVSGLKSNGSVNWNHHFKAIPYDFVGKFTWEHTTPEDFYGFILDFDTRSGTSGQMVLGPVKAEIGTLATDWTPAPEDIEADISAANALAQSAKNTADGKITTFYAASTATPTATTVGDLWIKTDDGNSLWRWNGSAWVSVDNADIQSALTAAGTAQATADSKIITFAQTSEPTATDIGDIWIDTDDSNRMYRWNGTAWVDVHDPKIAEANEKIDNLQIGGRNLLLNSEHFLPGSGIFTGSDVILYSKATFDGEGLYCASGSKYVKVTFPNLTIGEQYAFSCEVARQSGGSSVPAYITINGEEAVEVGTAKALVWTKFNVIFTATSSTTYAKVQVYTAASNGNAGWVAHFRHFKLERGNRATDWTPAPEDLDEAITAAQETANGKNTVYYQTSTPTGGTYKTNDIWFDTNDGNKMYMWNGSTWVAEQFGNAAISDLSITNAKIANGTIQNAKIANLDAGKITAGTMSASRIKGDTLTLGGANNVDGMMAVYDANGNLVGSFTREGLMAIAGTIGGWTIGATQLYNTYLEDDAIQHSAAFSPTDELQFSVSDNGTGTTMLDVHDRTAIYGSNGINFAVRTLDDEWYQSYVAPRGDDYGVRIGPALDVYGPLSSSSMKSSSLELQTNMGSYVRQPAMIMSGSTTISTGTSSKRATICTIPVEYQTGWRIIPFVTRTYGNSGATPADAGDFYYAYYNNVDHKVCVKLANVLASGTAYTFDYMIYAVPTT